ncbi:8213_t:CDS:2 [Funneliformis geosporum]|nr:8213_t:CDS:2 [Funneliformis geosporum]
MTSEASSSLKHFKRTLVLMLHFVFHEQKAKSTGLIQGKFVPIIDAIAISDASIEFAKEEGVSNLADFEEASSSSN